jgi:hypothetical protein
VNSLALDIRWKLSSFSPEPERVDEVGFTGRHFEHAQDATNQVLISAA